MPTAHYLQSFAFTNGTQHSVVVMNLSRSGSLPVTFSGANAPTGDVLISQLTSTNITDNNEGLTSDTPVVKPHADQCQQLQPGDALLAATLFDDRVPLAGFPLPASTTTLTHPTSGTTGQNITLTATVASQAGRNTPTGTVTFLDGATTLGTGTLNASGVATFSTTTLPAGADSITASYGGDNESPDLLRRLPSLSLQRDADNDRPHRLAAPLPDRA